MSTDPHMAAVAAHIEHVVAEVGAGKLHQADALAVLAADLLGLSLREHVHPDTADVLLAMATDFANQRYAIVNAAAVEIPDDASGIDGDQ
jgi:hypothetical protein